MSQRNSLTFLFIPLIIGLVVGFGMMAFGGDAPREAFQNASIFEQYPGSSEWSDGTTTVHRDVQPDFIQNPSVKYYGQIALGSLVVYRGLIYSLSVVPDPDPEYIQIRFDSPGYSWYISSEAENFLRLKGGAP